MDKRFPQNKEFHKQYSEFLSEFLALGHVEEVPANELKVKCVYLLLHAVVTASSLACYHSGNLPYIVRQSSESEW